LQRSLKRGKEYKRELDPATYGFSEADMDRKFFVGTDLPGPGPIRTLRETINLLRDVYCNQIGVQYMHVHDPAVKSWVQERIEHPESMKLTTEEKKRIYKQTVEAESFETYCGVKFKAKRFGLDGGESLIPGMHALVESACQDGVQNVVIGMPHRGRLNLMANIMGKPLEQLFSEFQIDTPQGKALSDSVLGSGDVKYHLGTSNDIKVGDKTVRGPLLFLLCSHSLLSLSRSTCPSLLIPLTWRPSTQLFWERLALSRPQRMAA
jgi:2-oxoglutarate dehydrogenase E1 component